MSPIIIGAMILAASMAVMANSGIQLRSRIEIIQPGETQNNNVGSVKGFRPCGGPGRIVDWRVEGCSGDSICNVPAGDQRRQTEYEFIPSEDIGSLGIRLILINDGEAKTVYERAVSDSSVQGGETYIVSAEGGATQELQGQTVTLQYILYRVDNNNLEVCAEAEFNVV